jgi:predicted ATPase
VHLNRINVQAFRSLYDITVTPSRLQVVVGPNNAGKSNLANAIDFVGDVHRYGLEIAISRQGGFENIAFRRMRRTRQPLRIDLSATLDSGDIPLFAHLGRSPHRLPRDVRLTVRHAFEVDAESQAIAANIAVRTELLEVSLMTDDDDFVVGRVDRSGSDTVLDFKRPPPRSSLRAYAESVLRPDTIDSLRHMIDENTSATELTLRQVALVSPALRQFERALSRSRVFQFSPLECRRSGVPTPNAQLDRHGGNLPALVFHMQRHRKASWRRTLDAMRRIIPGLDRIEVAFTSDRRLTLQFFEHGVRRPWTSQEVSDGTIQALALIASVNDARTPVAVVEEPENSVHPWIVRSFVDAITDGDTKQVIITTHSPIIIDHVAPNQIVVMWRDAGGRSNLMPLDHLEADAMMLWEQGKVGTFELLDTGWVRESVPEGLR